MQQLNRLEEEFYLICQAPLSGVENAYTQLRTVPLKEIDIHLDILFCLKQKNPAENSGRVYAKRFYTYGNASFSEKIPEKQREEELYDDFYWEED